MTILDTALDPRAPSFLDNRSTALAALLALDAAHLQAREGGGEREVTRHHARGKLLPRERIELLIDRDTPLLELAATVGAGTVTAIGNVERVTCMIVGNDPTVRESGLTLDGLRKARRAIDLAHKYELPLIFLWESDTEASQINEPGLCAIFGSYACAPLADHCIAIRGHGDPSYVDAVADDERDAIRLLRTSTLHLVRRKSLSGFDVCPPRHEPDDLLATGRDEIREVLARILDGSAFEEFRAHTGQAMVTGFGAIHGYPVAIIGNSSSHLDGAATHKALELARQAHMPLLLIGGPSAAPQPALSRALAQKTALSVLLGSEAPDFAVSHKGFRFSWPGLGAEVRDGLIDPRDTRTVLGICLAVLG